MADTTPFPTAVFDLGGVLLDYNPRYLFRRILRSEEEVERLLAEVITEEWNCRMDCSSSLDEGVAELAAAHPRHAAAIRAFRERWIEMVGGALEENVRLLQELHAGGVRLVACSNWAAETFPLARPRFPFLELFDGILLSGEVGYGKPEAAFYRLLEERFGCPLDRSVFVDDNPANVEGAARVGLTAVQYTTPARLRRDLSAFYPFLEAGAREPAGEGLVRGPGGE